MDQVHGWMESLAAVGMDFGLKLLGAIAICVFAIAADRSSIHGAMEFILPALVLVTLALSLRDTRG